MDYDKEVELGRQAANRVFANDNDIELLADALESATAQDFN